MQQTALNLTAIAIFTITLSSLVGPFLHISPLVPTVTTIGLMGLLGIDTLTWQNRGISIFLDLLSGQEHRRRIIHHEAGHFLIAYLLHIPIADYSLSALEAWRKGQLGLGGIILDQETLQKTEVKELPITLERLSTVWMAGIAAEQIVYNKAEGGEGDRQQLYAALQLSGSDKSTYPVKERFAILQAKTLLQKYPQAYQTLVELMERREPVHLCYKALNLLTQQS